MKCSEVVRKAIISDSRSLSEIARKSKTAPSAVSRFVNGERGLSMGVFDRICLTLNLTLQRSKTEAKNGR